MYNKDAERSIDPSSVCELLNDNNLSLDEKLEQALELGASDDCPYAAFFHGEGHGALCDRLSLAMCEAVRPHLRTALEADVRIYSEAEMRRILGTWFSDESWRRVGSTACVAVAHKGA